MAIHSNRQIYDQIRMYNEECKWTIFCPNRLGQRNIHLHSSLNDLYLLLVHPLK